MTNDPSGLGQSERAKPSLTEAELIKRLRVRYTEKAGNGDAWAFIPKVRSAAAFDAKRTIDAYAMALWPSRGLSLHAFELKSSRSDWLREMRDPAKAEEFCELTDYFWLVVGDAKIVQAGELPETWGLMIPHGAGLKVAVEAPRLREAVVNARKRELPPEFSRSFLAALLRSACAVGGATPAEIVEAREEGRQQTLEQREGFQRAYQPMYEELYATVREFEQAAGFQIRTYNQTPAGVGDAVRKVLSGDTELGNLERRFAQIRDQAQRLADQAGAFVPDEAQEAMSF